MCVHGAKENIYIAYDSIDVSYSQPCVGAFFINELYSIINVPADIQTSNSTIQMHAVWLGYLTVGWHEVTSFVDVLILKGFVLLAP